MGYTCEYCGSSSVRRTTDEEFYFGGASYYCESCDSGFKPREYDDRRKYTDLDSPTSLEKKNYESDEDYRERLESMGYDPDDN